VKRLLIVLLLSGLFLGGCSWIKSWGDDDEAGAPAPLVDFKTSLKVKKIWSTSIGDGMGKQGLSMAPRYSSGVLFAADYKGRLVAVNAETGGKNWEQKTEQPFSGGPGLDEDQVYMGTIDGRVIAYDRNGGAELWNAQVSSEVLIPPESADGIVVVRCIDGRVFGLDAINGRRIWIYDHSVPLLTLRGNADLLVRGGNIFIGYDDGSVASDLIVSSYKNRVVSLAADSGRLLWFNEISSATGIQVDRTNLAVAEENGNLWMLDRRNGSTIWKIDRMSNRGLTRPAFYGNFVVVGDEEGYLHWIDTQIGSFVAREKVDSKGFAAAPFSVGTTLYVLTHGGKLIAYRAGAAL